MRKVYLLLLLSGLFLTGYAQTSSYSYSGSVQTFNVPPGVSLVGIDLAGAQGGNQVTLPAVGGNGGRVQCTLNIAPGTTTLYVYIGQAGVGGGCGSGGPGGNNSGGGADGGGGALTGCGGSGGGGATDIRTVSGNSAAALSSRLVVGGGGGGSAWGGCSGDAGGPGGGLTGGLGSACLSYNASYCGGPGTPSSPGAAANYIATGSPGGFGFGGLAGNFEGGGGGGGWFGAGGASYGGACGGSSYYGGAGVTNGGTNGGYRSGNGYCTITILCSAPGAIVGNAPICNGQTLSLTNPTASGGTWSSSNPLVATVNSSGLVTSVAPGNTTITYNLANPCGALATAVVTVNTSPSAITGAPNVCTGFSTALTSSPVGGAWTSSNASLATLDPTGALYGVAVGTPTVTYTLPVGGCRITRVMTVNTQPASILGPTAVCTSQSITVSDGTPGGAWSASSGFVSVSGAGTVGTVTGVVAGSAIVSYTMPTGCSSVSTIIINALPVPIVGPSAICVGQSNNLTDASVSGIWSSDNAAIASVAGLSGVIFGIGTGNTTFTYTLAGGCFRTTPITVNTTPSAITGTTSACTGLTSSLSSSTPGGIWSSSNLAQATVNSSGLVTGVSAGTPIISYSLGTGCYTNTVFQVNALPSVYSVTGGGAYCVGDAGVHVGLSYSNAGVNYQLYRGVSLVATVAGSNSGLDFGVMSTPGTYTVVAVNQSTLCTNNMAGSVTVSVNALPGNGYSVAGGGSYCNGGSGSLVTLSGSDGGISYQLYYGVTPTGSAMPGTGGSLSFGLQTVAGMYTVIGTDDATGCHSTMSGGAVITINALPTVYTLTGGGGYCLGGTGVHVKLNGSDVGTNYQLYYGGSSTGTAMPGTGSLLDFGAYTGAGAYTIVATNAATCVSDMLGSPVITINPLPTSYSVTGGGGYCAGGDGVHVGLSNSDPGFSYQLYNGGPVGSAFSGAGSGLDFGLQTSAGTYTIVSTNNITGCTSNMSGSAAVGITSLPNSFPVTGGGGYCPGAAGVHIGLGGSTAGVHYQLYYGSSPVGGVITGTGSPLDFGAVSGVGGYTVKAMSTGSGCINTMLGGATVSLYSLPTPYPVIAAGTSYCSGDAGIDISLDNSETGTSYQLYRGSSAVSSSMAGSTGSSIEFGFQTIAGVYKVVGTSSGTGCTGNMSNTTPVIINPLPVNYSVIGGGNFCAGGSGVHIGLSGSTVGINYQLYNGGAVGTPIIGTGLALDFGSQSLTGIYTIVATNTVTSCTKNMSGSAIVGTGSAPADHTVGAGGTYCADGTGVAVTLSGSNSGIHYQLYNGAVAVGSPMTGTGGILDFGNHTTGSYTVIASNPSTGCNATMTGTAAIVASPVPHAYSMTGGGNYCSDAGGVIVGLGNSDTGFSYQLYYSGSATGDAVAGTGLGLSFGMETLAGSYTVIATDTLSHCTGNMTGSAAVSVTTRPAEHSVTGGGSYCVGGSGELVGLEGSDLGIAYQLYNSGSPVGSVIGGSGGALNFGSQTVGGFYTVVASPGGVCEISMLGVATVAVNPLPTNYSVTGGGNYCEHGTGIAVGLSGSASGVKYQLYNGVISIGSAMTGTGGVLDFGMQTGTGAYSVVATDTTTGCLRSISGSSGIVITITPAPHAYNVTGGGNYCSGGTGVPVTLNGSHTNINYQLYLNGASTGSPWPGTGTHLDFGLHTSAGAYTVIGTDASTLCTSKMSDTVAIAIDAVLNPSVSISVSPSGTITKGQTVTLTANVTNGGTPDYQWINNGVILSGATNKTYISSNFSNHDSVICAVMSNGTCGGRLGKNSVVLTVVGTATVQQVSGDMDVTLVPNPNKGIFTLKGSLGTAADETVNLEITDMVGRVVYSDKITVNAGVINKQIQINRVLSNGMYLLNLHSAGEHKVFHMVIEQ